MRLINADDIEYSPCDEVFNYDVMIAFKEKIESMPTVDNVVLLEKHLMKSTKSGTNGEFITYNRKWLYEHLEQEFNILAEVSGKAKPVKHGQWIGISDGYADGFPVYDEWECSVCGTVFEDEQPTYSYCPCCGAKMDRGE